MFPTWDIRAHFVLSLVDCFWRMETSNINHFWAHCWTELQTHAVRAPPFLLPLVNHSVFCARCWPPRPDDVQSGTIRSLILPCCAMDDISRVKSWLSESPLPSEILLRAHKKNNQTKCSRPLFSWHTLMRRKCECSFSPYTAHVFPGHFMWFTWGVGQGRKGAWEESSPPKVGHHREGRGYSRAGRPFQSLSQIDFCSGMADQLPSSKSPLQKWIGYLWTTWELLPSAPPVRFRCFPCWWQGDGTGPGNFI